MLFRTILIVVLIPQLLMMVAARTPFNHSNGKQLFEKNCAACHGSDGTKGRWGAKNLQSSLLNDEALLKIINNGKRIMPSWKNRLTAEEVTDVMSYVKLLRR